MPCTTCSGRAIAKQMVKCKICSNEFHHTCVNVDNEQLASYNSGTNIWICQTCSSKAISGNSSKRSDEPTLAKVFDTIKEVLKKQDNLTNSFNDFRTEISELQTKVTTNSIDIEQVQHTCKQLEEKNTALEETIKNLLDENSKLKSRSIDNEKFLYANMLEITGVPEPKGENVMVSAQMVAYAVGFKLDMSMVDNCYRIHSNGNLSSSKIILKFVKKADRDEMLRLRKIKTDFSTNHLDKSLSDLAKQHNVIYINEFLSISSKKLLMKAKEYKKENKIKYLWIKNGSIFMRKADNSPVINIKHDLNFNEL